VPIYEVEADDGRTFEVEAPSLEIAATAVRSSPRSPIGYGRAALQGAAIDAPEAFGGIADLAAKAGEYVPLGGLTSVFPLLTQLRPEGGYAQAGRSLGESVVGPRQTGTTGEERLSRAVRGGLVAAPFALGGGPLAALGTIGGGAAGDVAQGEAERAGLGTAGSVGAGALADIAVGVAARNVPRAARGLAGVMQRGTAVAAKELAEEAGEAGLRGAAAPATLQAGGTPTTAAAGVLSMVPEGGAAPTAPLFAGNINLANLDAPDGVKEVLSTVSKHFDDFMPARRGVVPHAETQRFALELGWTADDLLKQRGRPLLAHELEAGRRLLLATGSDLDRVRSVLRAEVTPENIASFQQSFIRHVAVQEAMAGFTAETGRSLNILRKMSSIRDDAAGMQKLIEKSGGSDRVLAIAKMLDEMQTPGAANKFLREAVKATTMEKLVEAWKAGLLSGPQTHVVNAISNTVFQAQLLAEDAAASVGRAATGDKAALAGLAGRFYGTKAGILEGLQNAYHALRAEDGLAQSRAMETAGEATRRVGAIGGRTGRIVRMPFRLLTASDQLYRTFAERSKLHELAMEQAFRSGSRGKALVARARELLDDPDLVAQSQRYGAYSVFQADLGAAGKRVSEFLQSHPSAQFIVPFYKTPTNIFKTALERTPLSPLLRENRAAILGRQGTRAQAEALSRIGMGSAIAAATALAVLDGRITGSAPSDPVERSAWQRSNQPYSIRLPNGKWMSYARVEPLATLIGTAADATQLAQHMTPGEREDIAAQLALIGAHNFTSKTYLQGTTAALLAAFFPERYAALWAERFAGSFVPNIATQVTREIDPVFRDVHSMLDKVRSRVPGMSTDLPARIDPVSGEEIRTEGGVGPDFASPLWTRTPKNDPVTLELVRLRMGIGMPQREVGGQSLDGAEYEKLARRAGELGFASAKRLVTSTRYSRLPDEDKQEAIRRVYADARKQARIEVVRKRRGMP
jgi:hypothetical protein